VKKLLDYIDYLRDKNNKLYDQNFRMKYFIVGLLIIIFFLIVR
jgi:hypothetical protein